MKFSSLVVIYCQGPGNKKIPFFFKKMQVTEKKSISSVFLLLSNDCSKSESSKNLKGKGMGAQELGQLLPI